MIVIRIYDKITTDHKITVSEESLREIIVGPKDKGHYGKTEDGKDFVIYRR